MSTQKSIIAIFAFLTFILLFQNNIADFLGIQTAFSWLLPVSIIFSVGTIADNYLDKYFKAIENVKKFLVFILIRTLSEILAIVIVYLLKEIKSPSELLSIYMVTISLFKIFNYLILVLQKEFLFKKTLNFYEKKTFYNFGYTLIPTTLIVILSQQIDKIILGQVINLSDLGVYAFSVTLAYYVNYLSYLSLPLFQSKASKLYNQNNLRKLKKLYEIQQSIFLFLVTVFMILIVPLSTEIITFLASSEFAKNSWIFIVLCIALCIDQFFSIFQYALFLLKKTITIFMINFICLLMTSFFLLYFTNLFGVNGAPWSILIAFLITGILKYLFANLNLEIKFSNRFKKRLFISIFFILLSFCIPNNYELGYKILFTISLITIFVIFSLKDIFKIHKFTKLLFR